MSDISGAPPQELGAHRSPLWRLLEPRGRGSPCQAPSRDARKEARPVSPSAQHSKGWRTLVMDRPLGSAVRKRRSCGTGSHHWRRCSSIAFANALDRPFWGCMWASLLALWPAVSPFCRRCSSSRGVSLDHDRMRTRIGQACQIHGVDRAHTKHGFLTSGRRLQACRRPARGRKPRECRLRVVASCEPSRGPKWSKAGSTRQTLI